MLLPGETPRSSITFRTMRLLLIGLAADLVLSISVVLVHAGMGGTALLFLLPFMGASLLLLSASGVVATAAYCYVAYPRRRTALVIIVGLTFCVLVAHLVLISEPNTNSIMDEAYYAPAGQMILSGLKSNLEHPPLSKALIAVGMQAFRSSCAAQTVNGQTHTVCSPALGFRILPVVLGTACIPLVFAIAWRMSKDKKVAYYSSLLLALDTMFFVHSGAALLDVPVIFFALAAIAAYLYGVRFWIFDKYSISGVLMGLSILSKETAVFLAAALVTFHLLRGKEARRGKLLSSLKILVVAFLVFSIGLQVYDSLLAGSSPVATPTFVDDIKYILSYGSSLKCVPSPLDCPGAFHNPDGSTITPLDWLTYYVPTTYYGSRVNICAGSSCSSYTSLAYYGVTNMVETWSTFVWAPVAAYVLYALSKKRVPFAKRSKKESTTDQRQTRVLTIDDIERIARLKSLLDSGAMTETEFEAQKTEMLRPEPRDLSLPESVSTREGEEQFLTLSSDKKPKEGFSESELAVLALVTFCWTFFPYLILFAAGRVTYPFYFLTAVPATTLGISYLLTRTFFPRILVILFFAAVLVWFIVYFPDKSFLPTWIRSAIGT